MNCHTLMWIDDIDGTAARAPTQAEIHALAKPDYEAGALAFMGWEEGDREPNNLERGVAHLVVDAALGGHRCMN